jgi:hypothetical protein
MFKVTHEFLDKTSGTMYKVGDEYKGSEGEKLAKSTQFRPALVEKVGTTAKASVKAKEGEKPGAEKAEKKPKSEPEK